MTDPNRDPIQAELVDLRRQVAELTERMAQLESAPRPAKRRRRSLLCRLNLHRLDYSLSTGDCSRCREDPEPEPTDTYPRAVYKEHEHDYEEIGDGACMNYAHFRCRVCGRHQARRRHNSEGTTGCAICRRVSKANQEALDKAAKGLKL